MDALWVCARNGARMAPEMALLRHFLFKDWHHLLTDVDQVPTEGLGEISSQMVEKYPSNDRMKFVPWNWQFVYETVTLLTYYTFDFFFFVSITMPEFESPAFTSLMYNWPSCNLFARFPWIILRGYSLPQCFQFWNFIGKLGRTKPLHCWRQNFLIFPWKRGNESILCPGSSSTGRDRIINTENETINL